jgi:hypothetical protein
MNTLGRLGWPFHGGNTGSNPVGDAIFSKTYALLLKLILNYERRSV